MRLIGRIVPDLSLVAVLAISSVATAQSTRGIQRQVAVTFDDMPGVAMQRSRQCDARAFADLNRRLLQSIARNRIPALALVVESRLCPRLTDSLPGLLNMWLDAGHELGNHSFSHFDINTTPLARYEADVIRGERVTQVLLRQRGRKLKYFRHPFLHAGNDVKTKEALAKFLAARGYTIAPVTIDNQEWVFAEAYALAKERRDTTTARRIGEAYLRYMDDIFAFFEKYSVHTVGYEIKQILLLHVNPLNADYLDALARMMRKRGYAFISIDQALTDPAYRLRDTYAGPTGLSWLHRWALSKGMPITTEPREPEFIRSLSNTSR
jgi:peptidoglycan-N-acetylglucosamine deacetylase